MEDLLVLILQFVFEFLFNVLVDLPFDWPSKKQKGPEISALFVDCIVLFFAGCGVGWLSLHVVPNAFIKFPALRMANFFLAPVTAAFISQHLARRAAKANDFVEPRNHFWRAFWFTLALVFVRYAHVIR